MYFLMFCYFLVLALVSPTISVKMNVEGIISVGQEIMALLSDIFGNRISNARRSFIPMVNEDRITDIVRTSVICNDLPFCRPLLKFTEEYVTLLAKSVQTVLSGMLGDHFKPFIFEGQLKQYLKSIKLILENANANESSDNNVYYWIDTMKRISAKFQEMASIFVSEESQIDPERLSKLRKDLAHKLIIATVIVEIQYQSKLCVEHNVCIKSFEITNALNNLLEMFKSMPEEKVRLFIRYFYEALFDAGFYSQINEETAHELQIILSDMAYSVDVPTKGILSNIQEIVAARLTSIKTSRDEKLSHDAFLVHGILSDMDHIYSDRKTEPFKFFFQKIPNWISNSDFRIDKQIRLVMHDINKELWSVTDDLLIKLVNEVKVFLELTVDSVKFTNV